MFRFLIFLIGLCLTAAIKYGPIIDSTVLNPSVVNYKGVYYTVSSGDRENGFLTIRSSWDLRHWENETNLFTNETSPLWIHPIASLNSPNLQVIGENDFRIYFSTTDYDFEQVQTGVAYATNIMGPYHSLDRALRYEDYAVYPSLLNADGDLYLIWMTWDGVVLGRRLQKDGLGNADNKVVTLFKTAKWAGPYPFDTYSLERNGMYYIFYTGYVECGNNGIGVARSAKPLGPYETLGKPILTATKEIDGPKCASVAKFFDGSTDLLFFGAYESNSTCSGPYKLYARNMEWGADGWPYIPDQS